MVFVNTSLETALDRNRQRKSIPDDCKDNHGVVRKTWVNYKMHLVDKLFYYRQ